MDIRTQQISDLLRGRGAQAVELQQVSADHGAERDRADEPGADPRVIRGDRPGELARRWAAAGLPEPLARLAAAADLAIRDGEQDFTTTTVEELCGRPPRSFGAFARAHRDAWLNGPLTR